MDQSNNVIGNTGQSEERDQAAHGPVTALQTVLSLADAQPAHYTDSPPSGRPLVGVVSYLARALDGSRLSDHSSSVLQSINSARAGILDIRLELRLRATFFDDPQLLPNVNFSPAQGVVALATLAVATGGSTPLSSQSQSMVADEFRTAVARTNWEYALVCAVALSTSPGSTFFTCPLEALRLQRTRTALLEELIPAPHNGFQGAPHVEDTIKDILRFIEWPTLPCLTDCELEPAQRLVVTPHYLGDPGPRAECALLLCRHNAAGGAAGGPLVQWARERIGDETSPLTHDEAFALVALLTTTTRQKSAPTLAIKELANDLERAALSLKASVDAAECPSRALIGTRSNDIHQRFSVLVALHSHLSEQVATTIQMSSKIAQEQAAVLSDAEKRIVPILLEALPGLGSYIHTTRAPNDALDVGDFVHSLSQSIPTAHFTDTIRTVSSKARLNALLRSEWRGVLCGVLPTLTARAREGQAVDLTPKNIFELVRDHTSILSATSIIEMSEFIRYAPRPTTIFGWGRDRHITLFRDLLFEHAKLSPSASRTQHLMALVRCLFLHFPDSVRHAPVILRAARALGDSPIAHDLHALAYEANLSHPHRLQILEDVYAKLSGQILGPNR